MKPITGKASFSVLLGAAFWASILYLVSTQQQRPLLAVF